MQSTAKWLFTFLISLTSSCTIVHVVGEGGTVETHWMPGIAYIYIEADESPLYMQSETVGVGLSNKSLTLGYGIFEQVLVKGKVGDACLLISIYDGPTKRDFSFQKKDPEYVCAKEEVGTN
ncbi:hypothetical protein [Pseudomonas sp. SWRI179]|uniref:hypothetical protein n=1 Tax=Pseudomonas sp. SWRI179 TaxID=2745497 RepID=UPI001648F8DA|nr:hypothetical protein [Pseudomonas sp. SWRI179]MBC3384941.1 hypothetical protein [Pseudomonas sp. SWRI179]